MPMPEIRWRHNRERLLLPITVLPGYSSENPTDSIKVDGLLDTGATGLGIRGDVADRLGLRPKGQRRVLTANGEIMAPEYVVRVGFVVGDYTDPAFAPDQQLPYVLEREIVAFGLQSGFAHPALIGMAILGHGDLTISRTGLATLFID